MHFIKNIFFIQHDNVVGRVNATMSCDMSSRHIVIRQSPKVHYDRSLINFSSHVYYLCVFYRGCVSNCWLADGTLYMDISSTYSTKSVNDRFCRLY